MNLTDLQAEHIVWAARNFPNRLPIHPVLGVCEEAGELAHSALKIEQGIRGTRAEHEAKMRDAIGDVVIFLSDVCNQYGYDLQQCVDAAWDEVKRRDWIKDNVKGTQ